MFKMALLKRFMPIALSVCMVVQSVPATALAAEQTETVVEETQTIETETDDTDVEVSETMPSTKVTEAEPEQAEQTQEPKDFNEEAVTVSDDENAPKAEEGAAQDGENSDSNLSNTETTEENPSTNEISEEQSTENEEDTIVEETVEETSSEVESSELEASEVQNSENDLMEGESASAAQDNMSISIDNIERYMHSFYFSASLTGDAPEGSYFVLYYREKPASDADNTWESGYDWINSDKTGSFYIDRYNGAGLKDGTTYEYVLGIGDSSSTPKEQLKASVTSEVTTVKDTRKLTNLGTDTGYTYATLSARLTGNTQYLETYLCSFYRKKTDGNTEEWTTLDNDWIYDSSYNYHVSITGLEPGTTYECVIVADSDYVDSSSLETIPADRKVTDTFTTKKAPTYTLTFEPVAEKCTSDTEVLTVKASGSEDDTKLDVTLFLDSGREVEVSLKQKADYTNQVVIEGLEEEREYTIVKADVWATETIPYYYDGEYDGSESYEVKIASIDQQFKFKTKAAAVVTSIEIADADKELKLTKLYDAYDPYSYNKTSTNTMEVKVSPEDALSDIVWTSSNTSVARITSYYGDNKVVVSAYGVGEATITASSRKDPTKKAERKVIVKDYEVILTNNGVDYPLYGDDGVSLTKMANEDPSQKITNVATNIGFYEVAEDDSKTPLTDFNVISDKPGVANWVKDELTGIASYAVGATRMTFEKDGYKATIDVSVNAESRGFDITGLSASNSSYPAIDRGDNTYEIAYVSGISYSANGMISPKETFRASDFTWSSSNEAVATVNNGVITPLQKGNATITVKPVDEKKFTKVKERSFNLVVKEVPSSAGTTPTVYALTNTTKTLNDVKFPESWGSGWAWKEPQTPLYNIPVNSSAYAYAFEASYTGEDYYAYEGSVNVRVGTITGVYASETLPETGNYHNGVLLTGTDSLTLRVSPSGMGSLSSDLYTISAPTVKGSGLTVTPATDSEGNVINGQYKITASAAGKYTLNLEIKAGDKVIATGKYNLTVVADEQIGSITIKSVDETTVPITGNSDSRMISFDLGQETKEFSLTAEAHNRDTNQTINTTTKLNWTITDKSVADVKVDKTDTRKATVTVKGEGHAVIQVTAADAVGKYAQVNLEIRNHAPRVEGSKTTVNTAFDYTSDSGKNLSRSLYGAFEVIPVYDESISKVTVVNEDEKTESTNFEVYRSGYYCTIIPKSGATVSTGAYKCNLSVKTSANTTYTYPITVSVIDKKPKVTAKVTQGMNLFYIPERGEAEIKLESTSYSIESLIWEDKSTSAKGFEFDNDYHYKAKKASNFKYYYISQKNVKVKDGKPADEAIAEGKLTIKLNGVKDAYEFDNIKIKYNYKKPKLKTVKNASSLVPSMGATEASFYVYDNLKKSALYYNVEQSTADSSILYNEIICDNANVSEPDSYDYYQYYDKDVNAYFYGDKYIYFDYTGTNPKDTISLTLDSMSWRERLTVNHAVKVVKPKAVLSNAKLTYHTNYMNEASTYIFLKDYSSTVRFTDVAIEGANAKSQELLDNDRLQLIHSYDKNYYSNEYTYSDSFSYCVHARLNKLKLANDTAPSGSYAYNLTPYYTDQSTGEKKALNTLKLTITFTDKPITAKVSAKGTLDLAQRNYTSIRLTPKFGNMGSDYYVTNIKLVGEYSKYFRLYNTYSNGICDLAANDSNLKAGHTYNLAIEYTVKASGGETFTVTSNRFKVKPKQTAPKVTVAAKPQNLYAANADITRSYRISVPSTYRISSASGSIDVNKDRKADLRVSLSSNSGSYAYLTVEILDKDAVIAATKGKSYTIPVTVTVTGRDGISKDASTKIKVNIKR